MHNRIPRKQIDHLKSVPLFSSCTHAELRQIAHLGTVVYADEGAYLTENGKPGREFFLVLDGEASCRVGKKQVGRFTPGGYFGEMALLYGGKRTADVVATSPMELLVFDTREFRSMLMTTPSIGVKMLGRLAERVLEADARVTD
jgi:CRP-like cAMP-binding protein